MQAFVQSVQYVTVSITALFTGCKEKEEIPDSRIVAVGSSRRLKPVFAASPQNCNFMLITTSPVKRKTSERIHCVSLHMKP